MGTLHSLVSNERKRRVEETFIEFNDDKTKKGKKGKKAPAQQPRIKESFDEKGWNEAYKQACEDLTPEQLESCEYVSSQKAESSSNTVMTPEEFAAL